MSSDSTRPFPDWWQQPGSQDSQDATQGQQDSPPQGQPPQYQGRGEEQGSAPQYQPPPDSPPRYQGGGEQQDPPQGSQEPATNVYRGYQVPPPPPSYQPTQGYQSPPPPNQGQQGQPPYYEGQQGQAPYYGGQQDQPPVYQGSAGPYQGAPVVRRRRRRRWPIITLIVIVVLLVVADRAGAAITENAIASQIKSNLDLSGKPHVTVEGIPFLTQLAARDFKTVDINGTDETTGPLEIAKLTATLHGMHLLGLNSARIDQFNAMAVVTFAGLANAGGIPQGITLSAGPNNTINANVNILGFSSTATAQVTRTGPNTVNIKITNFGGLPSSVLGSLVNFNINLPKLPAGVSIGTISVTQQGLSISANGKNVTLSQ